jgi:predicted ArsR family transcriptional regulator
LHGARQRHLPYYRRMPKPTFAERLEALAALREPIRRSLYRYVERRLAPVSRDDAARAAKVSRAMAAFHLDKLVELGLLRAEYRRLSGKTGRGAGRPSKLYRRSRREFSVTLPKRNHELLARLLAETAAASRVDGANDGVAHRYGRSLGARARKRISSRAAPPRVSRCVSDVLEDIGFEPIESGQGDLWTRNCPFDPLSRQFPSVVCQAAIEFVGGVIDGVGTSSLGVERQERADRCCVVLRPALPSAGPL